MIKQPILFTINHEIHSFDAGKKCKKALEKMPKTERLIFAKLIEDLRTTGPVQPGYRNYSKLGKGKYHCHLSYHWVACWECLNGEYVIEVYYVGSRESAPY